MMDKDRDFTTNWGGGGVNRGFRVSSVHKHNQNWPPYYKVMPHPHPPHNHLVSQKRKSRQNELFLQWFLGQMGSFKWGLSLVTTKVTDHSCSNTVNNSLGPRTVLNHSTSMSHPLPRLLLILLCLLFYISERILFIVD